MDTKPCRLSVIIPTINEEDGIVSTLSELPLRRLRGMGFACEVIVVDGESIDRTRERAEQLGARVVVEPRRGYGRAYKTGFRASKGDILVALDGDHSYPSSAVPMLVRAMIEKDLDFITASRLGLMEKKAMSWMHRLGNWILSVAVRLLFGVRLRDSQSGMWVIRRDVLDRILPESDGMAFSEEIKIRAFRSCKCVEIPVKYRKRIGKSKITTALDGIKNLLHLLQLRFIDFRVSLPRDNMSDKPIDVVIFSMLYPPDFGGMSSRAYSIAKNLSKRYTVHVIASEPRYPSGRLDSIWHSNEWKDGSVTVTRLPIPPIPYRGFFNRLILFTWYSILAFFALIKLKNVKAVISAYPHPFIDFVTSLAKSLRSFKLIVDLSDLWPEAITLPNRFLNSLLQAIGYCINVALFRASPDGASVYNERALMIFQKRYGFSKPATVVYNTVDIEKFNCLPFAENCKTTLESLLRRDIRDKFVVLYSGTIGVYQKIENIVYSAQKIRSMGKSDVLFVIVGEGEEKDKAVGLAKKLSLDNIVFLPKVPRHLIRDIVRESDLALVPIVYPNKIALYVGMPIKWAEYVACGVPVLVPINSFIRELTKKFEAGFEVDFSDSEFTVKAIIDAMSDKERLLRMKRNARKLAMDVLSDDIASLKLEDLLEEMLNAS